MLHALNIIFLFTLNIEANSSIPTLNIIAPPKTDSSGQIDVYTERNCIVSAESSTIELMGIDKIGLSTGDI